MVASELIKRLEAKIQEYGDLPCKIYRPAAYGCRAFYVDTDCIDVLSKPHEYTGVKDKAAFFEVC